MTTGGWIVMLLSVGVVTIGFIWCLILVLRSDGDKVHSPADIHPDEYDHQAPGRRRDDS